MNPESNETTPLLIDTTLLPNPPLTPTPLPSRVMVVLSLVIFAEPVALYALMFNQQSSVIPLPDPNYLSFLS
jgi:hypothetical protein